MSRKSVKGQFRIDDYVLLTDGRIGQVMYKGSLKGKSGTFIGLSLRNTAGKVNSKHLCSNLFLAK